MGKITRIHPVSLNVIRGAFDYIGCQVNRITQETYFHENGSAFYKVTLKSFPENWMRRKAEVILTELNNSFLDDMRAYRLVISQDTASGNQVWLGLKTKIPQEETAENTADIPF